MLNPNRRFKDAIYEQLARIGKALGSGPRLEILDLLCQGPRTVDVLAKQAGQSIANTSHHLKLLRQSRLVESEKQGVHVQYRLADEEVCQFLRGLRLLAESRLLEVQLVARQYLEGRGAMEAIGRDDLIERVKKGEATILDVRPEEEYRAGHIPGALCVPLGELESRLAELPPEGAIVAYCRGPYCVLAIEAVEILRRAGFNAVRLEDGIPDWRARGLEVAFGGAAS